MLRAKQINHLSQCARSFYLTGSRCGTADGTPSAEDDKHTTRKQSKGSDAVLKHHKSKIITSSVACTASSNLMSSFGSIQAATKATPLLTSSPQVYMSIPCLGSDANALNQKTKPNINVLVLKKDSQRSCKSSKDHFDKTDLLLPIKMEGRYDVSVSAKQAPDSKCFKEGSKLPPTLPKYFEERQSETKYSRLHTCSSTNTKCGRSSVSAVHHDPTITEKFNIIPLKSNSLLTSMKSRKPQSNTLNANCHRKSAPENERPLSITKSAQSLSEKKVAVSAANHHVPAHRFSQHLKKSASYQSINPLHTTEHYHHVLQQQKWGPITEASLNTLDYKLNVFQANQVLKSLGDHSIAFGFFEWLKKQPGFKHDDYTYTTMIGILGKARQFNAMAELLREMIYDGCLPTVVTYNRMIHAFGRANFINEAVKVFYEMQDLGLVPDLVTYCTLIDIHAKAGFLDVALDLYQRMQSIGLFPDTFTYSVMVNCLGKAGKLADAQKMYVEMIKNGCIPNLVTYNIMIALQAKARNYPNAVKLYRDMQAAGFLPDQVTYSIVMEALGHWGRIEEAEAVFNEMRRDCVPDEPVYGLLIDLWGKSGNIERAQSWYRAMIEEGLKPNTPTCNSLLSAYCRAHRFSEARGVLLNMLWIGLVPSLQTYTLLLSYCTGANSQMTLCCELMAITEHPAHFFLSSLPNAEPNGQNVRDHTNHFFNLMHSEDRESKRGLVDAVVNFLHASGLKEEAGLVWEVASQRNVYPDSLRKKNRSHWLINLHVMSEGTAVTALSRTLAWFQRQILDTGIKPWRIDIITGWGRRSRVTGASLVRQAVEELLLLFQFPLTANSNYGCFVGCGEPLNEWLLNSYVERMHLL